MYILTLSLKIAFFFIFLVKCGCHNIDDFGAIRNNDSEAASIINGLALEKAFESANYSSTDRTVVVPKDSTYTFFFMKYLSDMTNITFLLEGTLKVNNDINNPIWPSKKEEKDHFSIIHLSRCTDLVITGSGSIHGQGYKWWNYVIEKGDDRRPDLLVVSESQHVKIHSFDLFNAPKFHIFLKDNKDVEVYNLNIIVDVDGQTKLLQSYGHWNEEFNIPTFPLNTDGIDPSGSNYYIHDCYIQNFDDAVAVKPNKKSSVMSSCSQNMLIQNINVHYSVGMSIGSVPPDEDVHCVRNITFENINFHEGLKSVYIKTDPGTSGTGIIEDITYRNIFSKVPLWYPIWIGPQQQSQPHGYSTGCSFFYPIIDKCPTNPLITIRNILLQNLTIEEGVTLPGVFLGDPNNPIQNLVLDSVKSSGEYLLDKNYVSKNVNCEVKGDTHPAPSNCKK